MKKLIISLIILCSYVIPATAATTADFATDAPDRYVVVRATHCGRSPAVFEQPVEMAGIVENQPGADSNPHRIYPGDVLVLDRRERRCG